MFYFVYNNKCIQPDIIIKNTRPITCRQTEYRKTKWSIFSLLNTSLKLPVGVSPLQLVNLHRNRRYIFRHKTSHMVLSIIFLEDKHKIVLHLSILYEYQHFFQHRICFSIQPPDYSDPWRRLGNTFMIIFQNFQQKIFFICMIYPV